jgi:hypothetical protein
MTANCNQGALKKLAMKEGSGALDWASGATGFPFFSESLKRLETIEVPDVITGSREENSERARYGPNFFGGWLVLACNPADWATIMPWILGSDAVGTTFARADTLQTFGVLVDKGEIVLELQDCVVNQCIIEGSQGGPGRANWLRCALQIYGKGDSTGTAYPALSLAVTGGYVPFVFEDCVFTLGGSARKPKAFKLHLHNHVQMRYVNSVNPSTLCPSRRTINLFVGTPFDSEHVDLYDQALAGAAGSLAITNGAVSTTFNFATLQVPAETPEIPGKVEIDLPLKMTARKVGSTPSLSVTIDSSP